MKPTVGRIVHYVSYGTPGGEYMPEHRAAIVTYVGDIDANSDTHTVSLCDLDPGGMFFNSNVMQDEEEKQGGTWHWPEREA